MKIFIYILIAISVVVIAVNLPKLDFAHVLQGDSSIAVISILAGICSILLLGILLISKKIAAKTKR